MAVYKHESRSRVEYAHTNRITNRYSSEIQESVFLSFSQKPVTPFGTQKLAGVSVALEEKKRKNYGIEKSTRTSTVTIDFQTYKIKIF